MMTNKSNHKQTLTLHFGPEFDCFCKVLACHLVVSFFEKLVSLLLWNQIQPNAICNRLFFTLIILPIFGRACSSNRVTGSPEQTQQKSFRSPKKRPGADWKHTLHSTMLEEDWNRHKRKSKSIRSEKIKTETRRKIKVKKHISTPCSCLPLSREILIVDKITEAILNFLLDHSRQCNARIALFRFNIKLSFQ